MKKRGGGGGAEIYYTEFHSQSNFIFSFHLLNWSVDTRSSGRVKEHDLTNDTTEN